MHRHFTREIEKLKRRILEHGARVEEAFTHAVTAVHNRDAHLAQTVIDGDHDVDQAEIDIEEECLKLLALYQPVAGDLRFVVAVLKINNDLERIGDLAVNIAQRAQSMAQTPPAGFPFDFSTMSNRAALMLHQSLDALASGQTDAAREVCAMDDEVDAINRLMYERVRDAILGNPEHIETYIQAIGISRSLERIADHATDIAEDVVYMASGEIIRHAFSLGKAGANK